MLNNQILGKPVSLRTQGLILIETGLWTGEKETEEMLVAAESLMSALTHVESATEALLHSLKRRLKLLETLSTKNKKN
jgi:hypothetical protein